MTPAGIINLDKPVGISSARAVSRVKRLLPRGTKIGHAGTLDPFASGVLLLLVGKATKLCESLMDQPKIYEGTIKFGATTETDDPESPERPGPTVIASGISPSPGTPGEGRGEGHRVDPIATATERRPSPYPSPGVPGEGTRVSPAISDGRSLRPRISPPELLEIQNVLLKFIGQIQQRPPKFSALKVGGRRAYELARRGQTVELAARPVRIDKIEILNWNWPLLEIRVACGRGTYIRALARDIGEVLSVGGYLKTLRRTRIGEFNIENIVTLEQLAADGIEKHLIAI